jgi:hypothetical protein
MIGDTGPTLARYDSLTYGGETDCCTGCDTGVCFTGTNGTEGVHVDYYAPEDLPIQPRKYDDDAMSTTAVAAVLVLLELSVFTMLAVITSLFKWMGLIGCSWVWALAPLWIPLLAIAFSILMLGLLLSLSKKGPGNDR